MYTLADLKSEDHHIRVGEAFVLNQKRIIAEHAEAGMSTAMDEHWLSVFVDGLARHRMLRAEIMAALSVEPTQPIYSQTYETGACLCE